MLGFMILAEVVLLTAGGVAWIAGLHDHALLFYVLATWATGQQIYWMLQECRK